MGKPHKIIHMNLQTQLFRRKGKRSRTPKSIQNAVEAVWQMP